MGKKAGNRGARGKQKEDGSKLEEGKARTIKDFFGSKASSESTESPRTRTSHEICIEDEEGGGAGGAGGAGAGAGAGAGGVKEERKHQEVREVICIDSEGDQNEDGGEEEFRFISERPVHPRKKQSYGNFGALVTLKEQERYCLLSPDGCCLLPWWSRSFRIGYRNVFSDRRPPGIGVHAHTWGKCSSLDVPSFRSMLFGGGSPSCEKLAVPIWRSSRSPAVDGRHLSNLKCLLRRRHVHQHSLSSEDLEAFNKLKSMSESAQLLFAFLRNSAHQACGGIPASACRWFSCDDPEVRGAANELCENGFARRLQHVCDLPQPLHCILPVLDDAKLKKLYYERLGGHVSGLKDRETITKEICKVLTKSGDDKSRDKQLDRKRSVQTLIGQKGNVTNVYSNAILDILGISSNNIARRLTSPTAGIRSPLIISIADGIEQSFHRLEILFFTSAGFSPEDAAALMMCDLQTFFSSETPRSESEPSSQAQGKKMSDLPQLEAAIKLSDELEASVRVGDALAAYKSVERAANIFQSALRAKTDVLAFRSNPCHAVIARILYCGVGLLERDKRYKEAIRVIDLLLSADLPLKVHFSSPQLLLRKVMDLQHTGSLESALSLCEAYLEKSSIQGEFRIAMEARCSKLSVPPRRWKPAALPTRRTATQRQIVSDIPYVENAALQHYASEEGGGWKCGMHTENGIWHMLFGVLLADVLLDPCDLFVPEDLMESPLDFGGSAFFERRRLEISQRLSSISDVAEGEGVCPLVDRLTKNWDCYKNRMCIGVQWNRHSLQELIAIARCIGKEVIACVCNLFARDFQTWRHGLPDLIFWDEAKDAKCSSLLVEVKGPGDSLSNAQIAWIHELLEAGAHVEVCHVERSQ